MIRMLAVVCLFASVAMAKDYTLVTWKTIKLTGDFHCEGAYIGDFNKDGKKDVVSGPFWYEGPDFKRKHMYRPVKKYEPTKYSDNFLTYVYDFNGDGWDDVFVVGWPGYKKGHEHCWYENPKGSGTPSEAWKKHMAFQMVDNESPTLGDLTGDGKPELIFHSAGTLGWASPDWKNPTNPWTFHKLSKNLKFHRYTHGLGYGDIDGDGRADVLMAKGWWQQPASTKGDPLWKKHDVKFSPGRGGAQMFAYDVDDDGDNDVITSLDGHGFGLSWFEQTKADGKITFKEHRFMGGKPEENRYGVKFSQLHALDLVDIDGDGVKDIVTGKRFWAHGPKGDVEPNAPAVLYWFRTVRRASGVDFVPYQIHDDSGVGTQVTAGDFTGDGAPDIVVGNKKGTHIHIQIRKKVSEAEFKAANPKPLG